MKASGIEAGAKNAHAFAYEGRLEEAITTCDELAHSARRRQPLTSPSQRPAFTHSAKQTPPSLNDKHLSTDGGVPALRGKRGNRGNPRVVPAHGVARGEGEGIVRRSVCT